MIGGKMNHDLPDLKELQDRLLRVENQNLRFKQLGVAVLAVVAVLITMGQVRHEKTIEANEFILRDGNGNVRARLSMNETLSNPEMVLLDDKGKKRIELEGGVGSRFGGIVSVFDTQGQQRGLFSARDIGGGISLLDSKGTPRTTLSPGDVWVAGGIRLEDDDGFAAWLGRTGLLYQGENQTASAASLILVDNPHGKLIWRAP
jgi:hypothetical protein